MNHPRRTLLTVAILFLVATVARAQADPLPSWNDGANKHAFVDFVTRVTRAGGPDFGLQWTAAGMTAGFMGLVRHTDAEREWAYDRNSQIGKLDRALDEAISRKWVVVDMKQDWKVIYPVEQ